MRVFELAKILNVPSQQIIKDLKRYHVQAKTHMSSVDDKVVRKLLNLYEKRRIQAEKKAEELKKKKEEEERRKREEEEERRRREEEERKKREEEERKRREEEARRKREEEERRRKQEEEKRREIELRRRSSRLEELLQRRQIGGRPPAKKPTPPKEKKALPPRRGKEKFPRSKKEGVSPAPVLDTASPRGEKGFPRKKKPFKKRRDREDRERPGTGLKEGISKKRIRPTIFVAPPKSTKEIIPPLPQKPPVTKKEKKEIEAPKVVELRGEITVGEFAEKIGIPAATVITKLLELGEPMTINQMINPDLCELLAEEFGVQVKIVEESDETDVQEYIGEDDPAKLQPRPPVVTVMGHVDHGKTTLLDRIRKTDVVGQEFGGITQHIGAYFVQLPDGRGITFLDTPGHEAFTKMRARGAQVTDIVILVVAANDGVMPQTVEAINHARAARVPIIVAINKIDLPEADPMRVKNELMRYELIPEEFGGDTIFCEISAKQNIGIDHLLEMVLLQAEIMELKADPSRNAVGVIIESHLDPLRGPLATVLVKRGTLKPGDAFVAGTHYGKVRAMYDDYGRNVQKAPPSFPVEVIGFNGVPEVGETFVVVPNERTARRIAEVRKFRIRRRATMATAERRISLESLHEFIKEGAIKELKIILKADVQGSIEAISEYLQKLSTDEVRVSIIHKGVGRITESDVDLAVASNAIIIGFNTVPDARASSVAEQEKVEIRLYRIIYDLVEDVKKALEGLLEVKYKEIFRSRLTVKQVFRISKVGNVAGCLVEEGEINIKDKARLIRDGTVVYEGSIASLRRVKEDVSSVKAGTECGVKLANFDDIKEGDIIETYQLEEIKPTLDR